jgi:asparagine synthase (glutamine-hydrolysing)
MCGIAGIVSKKGFPYQDLEVMSSALRHRGPDGHGYMLYSALKGIRVAVNQEAIQCQPNDDAVGFAHRRLAIIDLSERSAQPMMNESRTCCVTFNGEIYNYKELRKELEGLGYSFKTTGDTEVLLRAYEAWGPGSFERFNGMWALVLLDTQKRSLILSRDRFGIKPLYYSIQNHTVYFASEIKGILAVLPTERAPHEGTVAKYLMTGLADDSQETFFNGILQFPAAHWGEISLGESFPEIRLKRYWSFPTQTFKGTEGDALEQFQHLFFDAVRIHAQSDVPIGTCLSGGLDSSSIVSVSDVLRRDHQIPHYTHSAFGYCPEDQSISERRYADLVVNERSVDMHYVDFSGGDFEDVLGSIFVAQDEPFGSASIAAQWFVFREAKRNGMTVMLDGQGADEILGGYHANFATMAWSLFAERRFAESFLLRSTYQREIGPFPVPNSQFLVQAGVALTPKTLKRPLRNLFRIFYAGLKKTGGCTADCMTENLLMKYTPVEFQYETCRSFNQELQNQVTTTFLPALLRYEDRNSMAHSIEARVPFLDYRLVEFLFTLPVDLKIRKITTKYILRQAMKGILPEAIRNRKDKMGFKANPDLTFGWINRHLSILLKNETEYERQWLNPAGVERLFLNQGRSIELEFLLWRLLNLKLWARMNWKQ